MRKGMLISIIVLCLDMTVLAQVVVPFVQITRTTNVVNGDPSINWKQVGTTASFTQLTNTTTGSPACPMTHTGKCANFSISMTTPTADNITRLAFYSDCDVLRIPPSTPGPNPDCNYEIFRWVDSATSSVISQLTNTLNCENRLPSITADGFLISFTSTCLTGTASCTPSTGVLAPCIRYDNQPCSSTDGSAQVFFWDETFPNCPFTQITQTMGGGGAANFRTSMADNGVAARIAFWSNRLNPAPVAADCQDDGNATCNNPNGNHQLFVWTERTTPHFRQVTPNQSTPSCSQDGPSAVSLNSAGTAPATNTKLGFSYNCNPVNQNGDGNYEIFRRTLANPPTSGPSRFR